MSERPSATGWPAARAEGLDARIINGTTTRADVEWLVESLETVTAERDEARAALERQGVPTVPARREQAAAETDAISEALRHFRHQNKVSKAPYFILLADAAAAALVREREAREELEGSYHAAQLDLGLLHADLIRAEERAERAEARVAAVREKAKRAKSIAAAPDYDEEAIRAALWALVDEALSLDAAGPQPERQEPG